MRRSRRAYAEGLRKRPRGGVDQRCRMTDPRRICRAFVRPERRGAVPVAGSGGTASTATAMTSLKL